MEDIIAKRDEILSGLVSLRGRYREMCVLQGARLGAISIASVPDDMAVGVERAVISEETSLLAEFIRLSSEFPACEVSQTTVVSVAKPRQGWLPILRQHEVLVEEDNPAAAEARLQDDRLIHLVNAVGEDVSQRRAELQHASYIIKRAVVGLNQSVSFSISEADTRPIERERHRLEGLVSLLEQTVTALVISGRQLGALAEARSPVTTGDDAPSTLPALAG